MSSGGYSRAYRLTRVVCLPHASPSFAPPPRHPEPTHDLTMMRACLVYLMLGFASALRRERPTSAYIVREVEPNFGNERILPRMAMRLRLRGGASSPSTLDSKPSGEPALTLKFAAYVTAWAVVPTLLRLAYAAATMPVAVPEPPPTMLQSIGVLAAASTAPAAALPLPEWWQVALAAAWVLNNLAVMVPGRYDGRSAMAAEKPTTATANLFTPSGWAFIIWGPIFFGEWLMMLYLTNVPAAAPVGAAVAPGWIAAVAAQTAWCASFRPNVCGPGTLWLPAALLATTGACLGVAHRALRSMSYGPLTNALVRWPLTLHFGWICAAALVNFNNWLAKGGASVAVKQIAACASVVSAVCAAVYVTATTRDPIFAAVVAWALAAVAADGAKSARGLVPDAPLDRVRTAARLGCAAAVLLVCTQV